MICLECGVKFVPLTVMQKYCCRQCGNRYRQKHNVVSPSIIFDCAFCGKTVVTENGTGDRRTRFCSAICEKKYWRHPPFENETSRTNFRSFQEYVNWEKKTNT